MPSNKIRLQDFRRILPGTTRQDWTAILACDAMCREARRHKHFRRVSALLWRHDVEGLCLSGRKSEYDIEAGAVALGLPDCRSVHDIQRLLSKIFEDSGFAGELERFEGVAMELATIVHKQWL